jgi:hypothetical protein
MRHVRLTVQLAAIAAFGATAVSGRSGQAAATALIRRCSQVPSSRRREHRWPN